MISLERDEDVVLLENAEFDRGVEGLLVALETVQFQGNEIQFVFLDQFRGVEVDVLEQVLLPLLDLEMFRYPEFLHLRSALVLMEGNLLDELHEVQKSDLGVHSFRKYDFVVQIDHALEGEELVSFRKLVETHEEIDKVQLIEGVFAHFHFQSLEIFVQDELLDDVLVGVESPRRGFGERGDELEKVFMFENFFHDLRNRIDFHNYIGGFKSSLCHSV